MANTPGSRKAKGNRLEYKVAELYRRYGVDKDAKRQLMSGAAYLKGDIYKPNDSEFVDECKNQEKVSLWAWWNQTESQVKGLQKPVLHISGNHRPILTVMKVEDYMYLRQLQMDLNKAIEELNNVRD